MIKRCDLKQFGYFLLTNCSNNDTLRCDFSHQTKTNFIFNAGTRSRAATGTSNVWLSCHSKSPRIHRSRSAARDRERTRWSRAQVRQRSKRQSRCAEMYRVRGTSRFAIRHWSIRWTSIHPQYSSLWLSSHSENFGTLHSRTDARYPARVAQCDRSVDSRSIRQLCHTTRSWYVFFFI